LGSERSRGVSVQGRGVHAEQRNEPRACRGGHGTAQA